MDSYFNNVSIRIFIKMLEYLPQNNCPLPSNSSTVAIEGTNVSPPVGPAVFAGTLTDLNTGATANFVLKGLGGVTGLAGVKVSGSVTGGFEAFRGGVTIEGWSYGARNYGASLLNTLTYVVVAILGLGPRFCGFRLRPVFSSSASSHSLLPSGRPDVSDILSAFHAVSSAAGSPRKVAKSP